MLLEQTAAEEDLSAPGLSMTAGSKSVLISVNQCHRWFYNSYKGLQFSGVLTEARRQGGQLEAGSFSEILLIDSLCSPCGQASLVDLRYAPGLSKK